MPDQATDVAAIVEAVRDAVASTFSGSYGIVVQRAQLELQLVLTQQAGGGLSWQVLTVDGHAGQQQTQTLSLDWARQDMRSPRLETGQLTRTLIDGLSAADIGVSAWNRAGLPLTLTQGVLTFELAVSSGGSLSVALLGVEGGRKTTHTVTLTFGAA